MKFENLISMGKKCNLPRIPDFQKKRLQQSIDMQKWLLGYNTGASDRDVEVLENEVNGVHYPMLFDSEFEAKTYASWFRKDAFLNLRPLAAKDLF